MSLSLARSVFGLPQEGQRPLSVGKQKDDAMRFVKVCEEKNKLGSMTQEMCRQAGIYGIIVIVLLEHDVVLGIKSARKMIKELTGHRSLEALRTLLRDSTKKLQILFWQDRMKELLQHK